MKSFRIYFLLITCCKVFDSCSQCSFKYISNDTVFQDYIEFIYPRKDIDEIITIGSQINRGIINDYIFNAPVFEIFDYCGNILNKIIYKYVGNYKLRHIKFPTHRTYDNEPVGNTAIKTNHDEFLLVDKSTDTLSFQPFLILYKINDKGNIEYYNVMPLNAHESNQTVVKNVLQLNDGSFLIIMWDNEFEYNFYYFDDNLNLLNKKTFSLSRGIRSIKEINNYEFIVTSLVYDSLSFQFYKLDSSGNINWLVSPYNVFGSARDCYIHNDFLYIIGGLAYGGKGSFGVLLKSDLDGNLIEEYKLDTFPPVSLCSVYLESDKSIILGGYVINPFEKNGQDILIVKIDSIRNIEWFKTYNFINDIGTSGPKGYYTDYGGFSICKANDGGFITNGNSIYLGLKSGSVLHEDATLIKTESLVITSSNEKFRYNKRFQLLSNPVSNELCLQGPIDLIKYWAIYNIQGELILKGTKMAYSIDVSSLNQSIYFIKVLNNENIQFYLKFEKY